MKTIYKSGHEELIYHARDVGLSRKQRGVLFKSFKHDINVIKIVIPLSVENDTGGKC